MSTATCMSTCFGRIRPPRGYYSGPRVGGEAGPGAAGSSQPGASHASGAGRSRGSETCSGGGSTSHVRLVEAWGRDSSSASRGDPEAVRQMRAAVPSTAWRCGHFRGSMRPQVEPE